MTEEVITAGQWRQDSLDGKRCAVLGCMVEEKDLSGCKIDPSCGIHYCAEHHKSHFHVGTVRADRKSPPVPETSALTSMILIAKARIITMQNEPDTSVERARHLGIALMKLDEAILWIEASQVPAIMASVHKKDRQV